jgi:hypothetical protein
MGRRQCELPGCSKPAAAGGTPYCIPHGGGRRCQHGEGCTKSARGDTGACSAHGGGKRCGQEGCPRLLLVAARAAASRTEEASVARLRTASSPL